MELRVAGLEADLADYRKKFEAEEKAHMITRENIPKLEKMIAERDGQIDYMTKTIQALEIELAKFKNEVKKRTDHFYVNMINQFRTQIIGHAIDESIKRVLNPS